MTNKITKREMFRGVINFIENGEFAVEGLDSVKAIEMLLHEIELLERKNSSDKKPTAQQIANNSIKEAIYNNMALNRLYTVTEIQKEVSECNELSNQRVSALLRQMIVDGKVEKIEEKRKSFFRITKGAEG